MTLGGLIEEVLKASARQTDEDFVLIAHPKAIAAYQVFLIGNAKARRRWRRRNVPNSQAKEEKSGG